MLNAARDDDEVTGIQLDLAVAQFDDERAFVHQEQLVFVFMLVPNKFAFDLGDFDLGVIHRSDNFRGPLISETSQLLREIDFTDHLTSSWLSSLPSAWTRISPFSS